MGAIAGKSTGAIRNSSNYAEIDASSFRIGGIVGDGSEVVSCSNYGKITASSIVGGIAGTAISISQCRNVGEVKALETRTVEKLYQGCSTGGIVGSLSYSLGTTKTAKVEFCVNEGTVAATGGGVGGIAGTFTNEVKIFNCYNKGNITSNINDDAAYAGGIVGVFAFPSTTPKTWQIVNSYNIGNVTAPDAISSIGAIAGGIHKGQSNKTPVLPSLKNCHYLKSDAVNAGLYSVGTLPTSEADADTDGTFSKTETEMKSPDFLAALHASYIADNSATPKNEGYPVLRWEQGLEQYENFDIGTLESTGKNSFSVVMNQIGTIDAKDFTVTAKVNGVEEDLTGLTSTLSFIPEGAQIEYTFTVLNENTPVEISVKYKENTAKTIEYITPPAANWLERTSDGFAGGDGTYQNPYEIATPEQMAYFAKVSKTKEFANCCYALTADIDLSALPWVAATATNINFEGNNHKISGLHMSDEDTVSGDFALFTSISGNIQNLQIIAPEFTSTVSGIYTAGLTGRADNVKITNCAVLDGSISGHDISGGLVGNVGANVIISQCYSTADVAGKKAGGLVGSTDAYAKAQGDSVITNSFATGNISVSTDTTDSRAGGFIGEVLRQKSVTVTNCFSTGNVTASAGTACGGFIGNINISGSTSIGAGGLTVEGCTVLGNEVKSATGSVAGRIAPNATDVHTKELYNYSKVYALDTLTINGGFVEENINNGSNVTIQELRTRSFWEDTLGYDFSEEGTWDWTEGNTHPNIKANNFHNVSMGFAVQPQDTVAYRDQPALFGVTATGGLGTTYTYMWQYSEDGKDWSDISGATATTLTVNYGGAYKDGTLFRAIATTPGGFSATSATAKLSLVNASFTADDAVNSLVKYYENRGVLSQAKEAIALKTKVKNLSEYALNLPAYYTYYSTGISNDNGDYYPWLFSDNYALGLDPHEYTVQGNGAPFTIDAFAEILSWQNEDNATFRNLKNYNLPAIIINLDMYFKGSDWGNEKKDTALGRDAAIEYVFSNLEKHECGGYYFNTEVTFPTWWEEIGLSRSQSEAALLMARLTSDPKYGERAQDALTGLMKTLEYTYQNEDITSTEVAARYVSALVGAADASDGVLKKFTYLSQAKEVVNDKLLTSKAVDGGYGVTVGENPLTCDADATAAVMMALGDYTNETAILVSYTYEISDASSVANDLAAISIPALTTTNISLPSDGSYGSKITWVTSDNTAIKINGEVIRSSEDVTVTLTATVAKGDVSVTKDFTVIVKADADVTTDAINEALSTVQMPLETVNNIAIPTSTVEGVTFKWTSSNEQVIAIDGTVNRPAKGSEDTTVTMTLNASKDGAGKTVEYAIKVYAETEDSIKEGYYLTRSYYLENRTIRGYWGVWAAYSALGDYIQDPANGYTFVLEEPSNSWYGTQYGATVLALCAMGENPYNYNGTNWIKALQNQYGGPWAGPVFSALGMDAAAAGEEYYQFDPEASRNAITAKAMETGIDIAGWAGVVVAHRYDYPGNEEATTEALSTYVNFLKDMGTYQSGNLSGVNCISTGCAIVSLAAAYEVGITEADPYSDAWKNTVSGKSIFDAVYNEGLIEQQHPGYVTQMQMALCDMYNVYYNDGQSAWISCGVTKAKLDTQIAKANELLANEANYTSESIAALKAAMEGVNGVSEERRNAKIADYGEEYYTLYDAVRFAEVVGQEEIDREAAGAVTELINALPAKAEVTLAAKADVEKARAAYDGLTNKQKTYVEESVLAKLTDAETVIAGLEQSQGDKDAANAVTKTLNALPSAANVTLNDKEAVEAGRAAYDALTDTQKALVNADALAKLEAAEAKIQELSGKEVVDVKEMTDVSTDNWFYDDVAYVLGNGIFKGTSATTFGATESMTRGQFVTVLGRYAGISDSSAAYPAVTMFSDVPSTQYYASHVKWAVENGITNGTSGTTFEPKAEINRQDMATMMLRFAKVMGIDLPAADTNTFADDSDIRAYAKEGVYRLKAAGVINGKENNKFEPNATSKRSEVAAVLHRFLTLDEDKDTVVVDMEKFTLGQGFVFEPVVVEYKSGDTASSALERAAAANGVELRSEDSEYGYYLEAVKDNDTSEAVIPQYILDEIAKDTEMGLGGRNKENWLGEFDYYKEAGWMVTVNNEFIPVGAGTWKLKAGDVIRWQFSICGLGRDIGQNMSEDVQAFIQTADKDALVTAIAKASTYQKTTEAYTQAMDTLKNLTATQDEVDAAAAALQ